MWLGLQLPCLAGDPLSVEEKFSVTLGPSASKTPKVNVSISLGPARRSHLSGGPLVFLAVRTLVHPGLSAYLPLRAGEALGWAGVKLNCSARSKIL